MKHIVIVGGGFAGLLGRHARGEAARRRVAATARRQRLSLVSRDRCLTIRPRHGNEAQPGEHLPVPLDGVLGPIGVDSVTRHWPSGIDADRRAAHAGGRRRRHRDRSRTTGSGSTAGTPGSIAPTRPGSLSHERSANTFDARHGARGSPPQPQHQTDGTGRLPALASPPACPGSPSTGGARTPSRKRWHSRRTSSASVLRLTGRVGSPRSWSARASPASRWRRRW